MIRVKFDTKYVETGEPFVRELMLPQVPAVGEYVEFPELLEMLKVLRVVWDYTQKSPPGESGVPPVVALVRLAYIDQAPDPAVMKG